jgi:hypothetical protein
MKHYSSEQWADYLRATAPKRTMAEMKRHLETGCKRCEQAAGMWTTVLELAHKETGYQPPDSAVRMAKSYFAMCRIEEKQAMIPRLASLVFDSLRQPQLAGVRSMGSVPQHYLYRSGNLLVDVWMETVNPPATAALAGQILDMTSPTPAVKDMMVILRSGNAEVSATRTNQFGEFHLEIGERSSEDLHLTVHSDNKTSVIIPLKLIEGGRQEKQQGV